MQNIFIITPSLDFGGSERVVATIANGIDRNKFNLVVVVLTKGPNSFLKDINEGIKVYEMHYTRVALSLPGLLKLIWTLKPQVVLTTVCHLNLAFAFIIPLLPWNIKYIARESSIPSKIISSSKPTFLWKVCYKYLMNRFDIVICQSQYMMFDLLKVSNINADKITVINNPIDILEVQRKAEEIGVFNQSAELNRYFISVARLSEEKGLELLIRAFKEMNDDNEMLYIVGDGSQRASLELLVNQLSVVNNVKFIGFLKNPYPFIKNAKALIISSHYEGFPNVALEALACGTPIISVPALGGISEIINNIPECIITSDRTSESLAIAMKKFKYKPYVSMSYVSKYEAQKVIKEYEELFL